MAAACAATSAVSASSRLQWPLFPRPLLRFQNLNQAVVICSAFLVALCSSSKSLFCGPLCCCTLRHSLRRIHCLCDDAMPSMCVLAIGMNLPPVFLMTIRHHYALRGTLLDDEDLGRLAACPFIGLVIACMFTGPLADKYGAKVFCLAGNLCAFCGLILCALAPSVLALSTALVVLGLGSGMLDMVLSPVIGALNADNRSSSMNFLHSMYCTGAVLTTLVVQFGLGWQESCLLLSAPPIIICVLFSMQGFPSITEAGLVHVSFHDLIRRPWFIVALAAIFLGGSAEMGLAQWLPTYCEQTLGYPHWLSGFALTIFNVAMATGRIGIGYIGNRICSYNALLASCCVSFLLFVLASFLPKHLALTAAILVGMTGSPMWPTVMAVTADQFPGGGATMFGILACMGNAGGVSMPWLVGIAADAFDLRWGLAIAAFTPLLMLPCVYYMKTSRHHVVNSKTELNERAQEADSVPMLLDHELALDSS